MERRGFLKALGVGFAALAGLPSPGPALAPANFSTVGVISSMGFRIGDEVMIWSYTDVEVDEDRMPDAVHYKIVGVNVNSLDIKELK